MNSVHPEGRKCRAVLFNRYRHSSFRAERSAAEWSRGISPVVLLAKVEIPRLPSVARNDANW
jgi:hypothetical protein